LQLSLCFVSLNEGVPSNVCWESCGGAKTKWLALLTIPTTMDSTSSETVYPADDKLQPPEIEELSSPVPHTLSYTHASRSIVIAGWTVTATKLPISSSSESDKLSAKLGIPVPEMTFGNNSINIAGPNGWQCEFSTQEALDAVDKTGSQGMKVSYSEQWNRTRHGPAEE